MRFAVHEEVEGTRHRRYDIGDHLARQFGTWVATSRCGQEVATTRATRRSDKVTCPECKIAPAPGANAPDPHHPVDAGQPVTAGGSGAPSGEDAAAVCAELRDLSGRLARFEPVDPAEIEAFGRRVEQATGVQWEDDHE